MEVVRSSEYILLKDNLISCENLIIPISSISLIAVQKEPPSKISKVCLCIWIIMAVIGFVSITSNMVFFSYFSFGISLLFFFIWIIFSPDFNNFLILGLNSSVVVKFKCSDNTVRQVVDFLVDCINGKVNSVENNYRINIFEGNVKKMVDNSRTINLSDNVISGSPINMGDNTGNVSNNNSNNNTFLDLDMESLREELAHISKNSTLSPPEEQALKKLQRAKNKDQLKALLVRFSSLLESIAVKTGSTILENLLHLR